MNFLYSLGKAKSRMLWRGLRESLRVAHFLQRFCYGLLQRALQLVQRRANERG